MKKNNYLEIIGILSLSLLLTSSFAVSSCVPEMMKTFSGYDRSSVEFLISSPSIAMVIMIALTPLLSRYLSERFIVTSGLLILGVCGITPVFTDSYPIISATRILMGVGIGLLNAKAISLIGERFTGNLRSRLQGIRCSMETIGQASLMFIAGQLLLLDWNYAFLIYAPAFAILFMYLVFVPAKATGSHAGITVTSTSSHAETNTTSEAGDAGKTTKISSQDMTFILLNFLLGYSLVSAAVLISLRITSYIVDSGIGTATDGATTMSISVFAGFLAGLVFGKLFERLNRRLLPVSLLFIAVGNAAIGFGTTLPVVMLGACISNFCITLGTSYMFNGLSEHISTEALNTANSIVLIGCNLASCTISFILQAISLIEQKLSAGFLAYSVIYLILSAGIFLYQNKTAASVA